MTRRLVVAVALIAATIAPTAPATAHNPADRWRSTALAAGWPASQWPTLRCIIHRESRGDPRAYNPRDPAGGSRGLMQLNGVHTGWLKRAGIIRYASDLYGPRTNLRAARALYRLRGWQPWGGGCR